MDAFILICLIAIVILLVIIASTVCYIEHVADDNNQLLYRINKTIFNDGRQLGHIRMKLEELESMKELEDLTEDDVSNDIPNDCYPTFLDKIGDKDGKYNNS